MVIKRLYCMYYPDHIRFVLIYVIKTIIGKFYVGISFLYHKEGCSNMIFPIIVHMLCGFKNLTILNTLFLPPILTFLLFDTSK